MKNFSILFAAAAFVVAVAANLPHAIDRDFQLSQAKSAISQMKFSVGGYNKSEQLNLVSQIKLGIVGNN